MQDTVTDGRGKERASKEGRRNEKKKKRKAREEKQKERKKKKKRKEETICSPNLSSFAAWDSNQFWLLEICCIRRSVMHIIPNFAESRTNLFTTVVHFGKRALG